MRPVLTATEVGEMQLVKEHRPVFVDVIMRPEASEHRMRNNLSSFVRPDKDDDGKDEE